MVSNILIMKTDKNIIWVIALHVITFTFVIISWDHSFNSIGFNIVSGISCMLLGGSYLHLELSKYSEEGKVTWFSITHTIIPLIFLLFWAGIALMFYHNIVIMSLLQCLVTSLIPLSFSYLRIKRKKKIYNAITHNYKRHLYSSTLYSFIYFVTIQRYRSVSILSSKIFV